MALRSRQTILVKEETVYGTDPTPDPAVNGVRVENLSLAWSDVRKTQPNSSKPTFDMEPSIFGGRLGVVTMEAWIKGSGVAGDVPEIGGLLKACGCSEIVVPATSVSYKPITPAPTSVTMYFDTDEKRYIFTGSPGSASFAVPVGEPGKVTFSMTGHALSSEDLDIGNPTWNEIQPFPFLASTFLVDAFGAPISNISWDFANTIAKPTDPASADGYGKLQITGRAITGTIDPEETKLADFDWEDQWKTDAQIPITTGLVGTVPGNIWQANFPQAQLAEPGQGERENIAVYDVPFQANGLSGDDDFEIIFT